MPDYLGQALAHVDIRPKRAGYLVRSGRRQDFIAAVERACSRWGGLAEPIVPASATGRIGPAWRQVLEVAAPDVLFAPPEMLGDARDRVRSDVGLHPSDIHREDSPIYGTHALAPYGDKKPIAIVEPETGSVIDHAGCGRLASWDTRHTWETQGVRVETVGSAVELAMAQFERRTVIEATARDVGEIWATDAAAMPPVLWISERPNLNELLWFWNTRALALRGYGYGGWALVTASTATQPAFVERLRRWLESRYRLTTPDLLVNTMTAPASLLDSLLDALGATNKPESYGLHFREGASGPLSAWTQLDLRRFVVAERLPGKRSSEVVPIERPTTTVRVPSPVQFAQLGGHVRFRLSGFKFLNVPRRTLTASLFHRDAVWHQGELELETSAYPVYEFNFNVPDGLEVLRAAVESAGVKMTPSQAGRLGAAVLELAPDVQIFADPRSHKVVEALTTPRSRSILAAIRSHLGKPVDSDTLEALVQSAGSVWQVELPLSGVASKAGLRMPDAARTLEKLVKATLVRRGLRTDCRRCGLKLFVELEKASARGECAGCGAEAQYTAGKTGEPALHYRLNALLDRASGLGVLCHLYAWARLLERSSDENEVLLGANLVLPDGQEAEVDILGFTGATLFSGEAKTSVAGFTPSQIRSDVKLSRLLNADAHVVTCLQTLPPALVAKVEALATAGGIETWPLSPD